MRLYPLVLLASAAVLTGVTIVSLVSGNSKGEDNAAASVPPFFRDPDDEPCIVSLLGQNATNKDEARTNPGLRPFIPELIERVQKEMPSEFTVLDTIGKRQIAPVVLNRMGDSQKAAGINEDRIQAAKAVWGGMITVSDEELKAAGLPANSRSALQKRHVDMAMLRAFAKKVARRSIDEAYGENPFTKDNIEKWKQKRPAAKLSTVLVEYRFIMRLSFGKVRALNEYLERDETKLIETLLETWRSVTEFTAFLSIAKLLQVIRYNAVELQEMLLRYWIQNRITIPEVIALLNFEKRGLTYETMDTLVEFVALKEKEANHQQFDAFENTLKHLDIYFGVTNYFELHTAKGKGTNGQADAQPGTSHQDGRLGLNNIASKVHNKPSLQLGTKPVKKRKAENLHLGRLRKKTLPLTNDVPEDVPGVSSVLSLRPPGT